MRQEKLNEIKSIIPLIKESASQDIAITVWDRNGTVLHFEKAETFNLTFQIGYTLPDKNDKLFTAMNTGKTILNSLPKEVFGMPIEGKIVPIFDENKVVGCLTCSYSVENVKSLEDKLFNVSGFMKVLEGKVNDISNIVSTIKTNSSRTNMLALNASIEAARAGESGRGFSIVASELGKLSQLSSDSSSDIAKTLVELEKSMADVLKALNDFDSSSQKKF